MNTHNDNKSYNFAQCDTGANIPKPVDPESCVPGRLEGLCPGVW